MADVATLTLQIASSQAEAAAKRTMSTLDRLDMSAKQVGKSFQSLGLKMSAAVTAPFLLTANAAIRASAEYEKARISFGVFINDMQRGAMVFDDIVQLAAKTPLNVSGLQNAAQILLATGAATANSLIPTLENLGNIARADSGILQRLALNLGQVASQGKLTGRELRDFAVAGVPLLQTLAAQMGKSTAKIQEMVSRGQVGFDSVLQAFQKMTSEGGKFAGLMDRLSQTIAGKWTTAVDNVRMTLSQFADVFRDEIKAVLDIVIRVAQWFGRLSPEVKRVIGIVAGIAATIGPALLAFGGIITAVAAIKASLAFLGVALVPFLVITAKVLAIVGAIAVAVELVRRAFGVTWKEIGQGALNAALTVAGFLVNIRENWGILIDWISTNWQDLLSTAITNTIIFGKNLIKNIATALNAVAGILGALGGWVADNWEEVLGQIQLKIIEWAEGFVKFMFDLGKRIIKAAAAGLRGGDIGDLNIFENFIKGAIQKGTFTERLQKALDDVEFTALTDGFKALENGLPKFNTTLKLFEAAADKAKQAGEQAAAAGSGQAVTEQLPSSKLAGALEAGSAEAFNLLTQREEKSEKTNRKNLSANQSTAFSVSSMQKDGIMLKNVQVVGGVR